MMRPRRCCIDLRELAKDEIVVLGRDADACITDLDEQLRAVAAPALLSLEPHAPARRREVDRIAEQVADDVRHLLAIGDDRWHRRVYLDANLEAFPREQRLVQRIHLLQHLSYREARWHQRQLIRGASRVSQNLTDLRQQLASTTDDSVDALHLTVGDRTEEAVAKDLGVRDHRREGCAQIVRDVGEKLRLELVARAEIRGLLSAVRSCCSNAPTRSSAVGADRGCVFASTRVMSSFYRP